VNQADDRTLVEKVLRRGDERAFGELYARHSPALYGLALRLAAGSEPDAEDIVHDAWLRALLHLRTFEWRSALRSWLCGIVVHRWRELQRRRGRETVWDADDGAVPVVDLELSHAVDRVALERAVRGLADGYREVLVLHDVEGYTHDEIGELLGIRTGTSKSRLSRARRAMQLALHEWKEDA
jgi:RNA polymerase sigma-70 factor (ECF subfamily)